MKGDPGSARVLSGVASLDAARPDILGALAAGVTSMVFLARDARGLFALKRLQPAVADDPALRAELGREATFASTVRHPSVVGLRSTGLLGRSPYLAMDFVEGTSAQRMQVKERDAELILTPLPTTVAVRLLLDVLGGLDACHTAGDASAVIHGDVSPGNVLVGVDGASRLTDFGAACVSGAPAPSGAQRAPAGYAAPEAVRGEPLTPRADVFSAGVLLWELFAGRRLFHAPTRPMITRLILGGYIPDLASAAPTVPRPVAQVCARALSRDPADRYATAGEFRTELERAARGIYGQLRHEAVTAFLKARCKGVLDEVRRMIDGAAPQMIPSGVRPKLAP